MTCYCRSPRSCKARSPLCLICTPSIVSRNDTLAYRPALLEPERLRVACLLGTLLVCKHALWHTPSQESPRLEEVCPGRMPEDILVREGPFSKTQWTTRCC